MINQTREKSLRDNNFQRMTPAQQTEQINQKVRKEILYKRKHKLSLAESGAKARVLRALLGVKKGYTDAELTKPFVVVRYVYRLDTKDPAVRQQLLLASVRAMSSAYGPMALPSPAPVGMENHDDTIDISSMPEVPPTCDDPEPEEEPFEDQAEGGLDDEMWAAASLGERCLEIERLSELTGYDLRGFERKAGYKIAKLASGKLNSLRKNLIELQGGN